MIGRVLSCHTTKYTKTWWNGTLNTKLPVIIFIVPAWCWVCFAENDVCDVFPVSTPGKHSRFNSNRGETYFSACSV